MGWAIYKVHVWHVSCILQDQQCWNCHVCDKERKVVNFNLSEGKRNDVINLSRAWNGTKNKKTPIFSFLRSSVVIASDWYVEGHRVNSYRGLRFFLCPMLVTCWSHHFSLFVHLVETSQWQIQAFKWTGALASRIGFLTLQAFKFGLKIRWGNLVYLGEGHRVPSFLFSCYPKH